MVANANNWLMSHYPANMLNVILIVIRSKNAYKNNTKIHNIIPTCYNSSVLYSLFKELVNFVDRIFILFLVSDYTIFFGTLRKKNK